MMLLVQVPAPPAPPAPPPLPDFPSQVVISHGGALDPAAIVAIVVAALVFGFFLLRPLIRAWARRLEGGAGPEVAALVGEVEELRARLAEVEAAQLRLADLEERMDFTERLLTQQRESLRIDGGTSA